MERGPQDWDAGPSLVDSLLRHKWLVALAVLVGVLAAYGWSARQPERYEATLELFPQPSVQTSDLDPDRILRNHVERLGSAAVLDQAVRMSERPIARQQLKSSMSIEAAGDADVITIRVLDATPEGARYLAELIPRAYERALEAQAKQAVAQIQKTQNRLEDERDKIDDALRRNPGDQSLEADREAVRQEQQQAAAAKRRAQDLATGLLPPGGSPQADIGDEPTQPQPKRAAAVGGLLGLAISVALVSWRTGQQLRGGAAPARPAEIPEEVSRDLAILAEVDGSSNGQPAAQPAGDLRLLDSVSQELARPEPPWRRNRQPRDRKGAPAKAKATEVRGPAGGINDFNQLTASIQRIFRSLEGHRYRLYEQNVPQMAADDIANWFPVDLAVILLENDQGMLQVAGGVGLSSFEEHMTIEDNRELLLQVVEMGSKLVDEEERSRLAAANVPGAQAETLIVVPLIYDQVAFGMLLMGQRGGGAKQPALVEGDVDRVRAWARDISPYLRAWLLLRYLKLRLRMVQ